MARVGSIMWDASNGWNGEYHGQMKAGRPHGRGVLRDDADGDEYEGDFQNGKFHGKGTATYGELDQYDGEWKESKKHGHGVQSYDFGSAKYDGQWEEDKMQGYGIYSYADGSMKCGKWEQDKLKLELPREEVEAALKASKRAAQKEHAAHKLSYDAGLFDLLKNPKYSAHRHTVSYGKRMANVNMQTLASSTYA